MGERRLIAEKAATAPFAWRKPWAIASLLFLFMFVNFADKAIIGLAAVPMMRDLNLTPSDWGLVGSSFYYLFPLSAALVGFIVNRVPTKGALVAMGLIWALAQFPMLGVVSFPALIACRVALGAGEGPAFPVALHAAYKWFPDSLRTRCRPASSPSARRWGSSPPRRSSPMSSPP